MVRFSDLCSYGLYWASNTARLILDMVFQDYDFDRLLRILRRHVPQFAYRYAVSPEGLFDTVLQQLRRLVREGAHFSRARVHASVFHILFHRPACG